MLGELYAMRSKVATVTRETGFVTLPTGRELRAEVLPDRIQLVDVIGTTTPGPVQLGDCGAWAVVSGHLVSASAVTYRRNQTHHSRRV